MKAYIDQSDIKGKVAAPSSKSYTIRALVCAALAKGESEIAHPLTSDDTEAAISVLEKIGVRITRDDEVWRVSGGNFREPGEDLYCGESAATLRFMTAICSVVPGKCRLTVGPSLSTRPVKPLVDALRQLGVDVSCSGEAAPVVVNGGRLRGGVAEMRGDISSQFVTGLLLVAPLAEQTVKIRLTTPLESRPYVLMTIECLEKFGIKVKYSTAVDEFEVGRQEYRPTRYEVQGDWSSASYFLALGAMAGGVQVTNLSSESLQGDKMLVDLLRRMGARVEVGQNSVVVKKSRLKAIRADLTDCIDLLPTVAALAAVADGETELTGIERARLKESDRVAAVRVGLGRIGIRVVDAKNKLTITGGKPKGAVIDSRNDHRIAMAFSVLGVVAGNTVIEGAECVNKTFPEFWAILKGIGGKVRLDGQ